MPGTPKKQRRWVKEGAMVCPTCRTGEILPHSMECSHCRQPAPRPEPPELPAAEEVQRNVRRHLGASYQLAEGVVVAHSQRVATRFAEWHPGPGLGVRCDVALGGGVVGGGGGRHFWVVEGPAARHRQTEQEQCRRDGDNDEGRHHPVAEIR